MTNTNPIVELLPDGRRMRVTQEFQVMGILIPSGFITDLASVPRPLWWLFPRWGKWSRAAILHDYLYNTQPCGMTKRRADHLFREAMLLDGVDSPSAWAIWLAVALFGSGAWKRKSAFGLNTNLEGEAR